MRAASAHDTIVKKAQGDALQRRREPPRTLFSVLPQRALEERTFFSTCGYGKHPRLKKSREMCFQPRHFCRAQKSDAPTRVGRAEPRSQSPRSRRQRVAQPRPATRAGAGAPPPARRCLAACRPPGCPWRRRRLALPPPLHVHAWPRSPPTSRTAAAAWPGGPWRAPLTVTCLAPGLPPAVIGEGARPPW